MISWGEIFAVLLVSHLVGDFLLQTDWQAVHKYSGLSGGESRRALFSHILMYTVAFLPGLVWIDGSRSIGLTLAVAAAIAVPHLIQDDGRLLTRYCLAVKHTQLVPGDWLFTLVDQSFHIVALFAAALLAST